MDIQIENIRFCRQPTTIIQDDFLSINGERLTLDYLRQMNISAHQLLNRYAPLDVIEEYLFIVLNKEIYGLEVDVNIHLIHLINSKIYYGIDLMQNIIFKMIF
jgi:hypothetical protein